VDMGLLTQTAEPAREILGVETIDVVAHRGYFKAEDIEACEKVGCIPHVPRPQRGSSVREGLFRKDEFRYDAERHSWLRDLKKIDYGNPKACRDCPLRTRCTNDIRSVSRLENEEVLDRVAERLKALVFAPRKTTRSRSNVRVRSFTASESVLAHRTSSTFDRRAVRGMSQKGGKRAYKDRLGKDRSARHSFIPSRARNSRHRHR
jgi:hypothetical protein